MIFQVPSIANIEQRNGDLPLRTQKSNQQSYHAARDERNDHVPLLQPHLCIFCQRMIDNWSDYIHKGNIEDEAWFPHHSNIERLKDSAFGDCSICYQFWLNYRSAVRVAAQSHHKLGYDAGDVPTGAMIRSRLLRRNNTKVWTLDPVVAFRCPPDAKEDKETNGFRQLLPGRSMLLLLNMIPATTLGMP